MGRFDTELFKEKVKIPISAYDIFGYFIPGAIALLAAYFFEFLTNLQLTKPIDLYLPLLTAFNVSGEAVFDVNQWVLSVMFFIAILIIIYIIGHIVSSLSSFCIDRVLIFKGYQYPYQILLGLKNDTKDLSRSFYRGLFFWVNVWLLLVYLFVILYNQEWLEQTINWLSLYIVGVILLKVMISNPPIIPSRWMQWIESKSPISLLAKKVDGLPRFFIGKLFAGPYDFITTYLSNFIGSRKPFEQEFIESYKKLFLLKFGLEVEKAVTNNYWFCAGYIAEKSPALNAIVVNFLHMYSYARNVSTAFYLAFLYCFVSLFLQGQLFQSLNHNLALFTLPLVFFFLSLVMLTRFYYLYFCYYSKFIFRAFYVLAYNKH